MADPRDDLDERIRDLYAGCGYSYEEVGRAIGRYASFVQFRVHRMGIEPRSPGGSKQRLPHIEYERVRFLYERMQLSIEDTGKALGIGTSTTRKRLISAGVTIRSRSEAGVVARRRYPR